MTRFSFDTEITITIAGVELLFEAAVTGTYHPAQRAYTPPGEYGPIDPPEPELFEFDPIRLVGEVLSYPPPRARTINIGLPPEVMQHDWVRRALEEEARAAMQPDPDRARDDALDRDWERHS